MRSLIILVCSLALLSACASENGSGKGPDPLPVPVEPSYGPIFPKPTVAPAPPSAP